MNSAIAANERPLTARISIWTQTQKRVALFSPQTIRSLKLSRGVTAIIKGVTTITKEVTTIRESVTTSRALKKQRGIHKHFKLQNDCRVVVEAVEKSMGRKDCTE